MTEALRHEQGTALVSELRRYERNARTHSEEQVRQLVASIKEFGFTNPILVDESGTVVAGHGRLAAAEVLGLSSVPVVRLIGLNDNQRRALVLADNQLALNAGWDSEMLKLEISSLSDAGFSIDLLGFDDKFIGELMAGDTSDGLTDPDDAPDLTEDAASKPGDVWQLGSHRVACGDSTDPLVWAALMGSEKADACWCDPPYNVAYESKLAGSIKNDDMSDESFLTLLRGMFGCLFSVMKPGASIYVAHADTEGFAFRRAFVEVGFKLSGCLIWEKDALVLGRSDYQWIHERILYGWKPGSAHRWYGGRKLTTVAKHGASGPIRQADDGRWLITVGDSVLVVDGDAKLQESPSSVVKCAKPKRSAEHPTMKPTALIEKQLSVSARPGDLVVDCCGGSGSTLIAAERLGMRANLVELDPRFVDVIVKRWQAYTGGTAVHVATGEKFKAVTA